MKCAETSAVDAAAYLHRAISHIRSGPGSVETYGHQMPLDKTGLPSCPGKITSGHQCSQSTAVPSPDWSAVAPCGMQLPGFALVVAVLSLTLLITLSVYYISRHLLESDMKSVAWPALATCLSAPLGVGRRAASLGSPLRVNTPGRPRRDSAVAAGPGVPAVRQGRAESSADHQIGVGHGGDCIGKLGHVASAPTVSEGLVPTD